MDRASSSGSTNLGRFTNLGLWLFLLVVGAAPLAPRAQAQATQWQRQVDGLGIRGVAADSTGIYVVGIQGHQDGTAVTLVARYDATGNVLWSRELGAADPASLGDVAVNNNFVYVGTTGSSGAVGKSVFLAKLDITGTQIWTRSFASENGSWVASVAADSSGVYVGGSTIGALPGQSAYGPADAFIRKYDLDGNELWTRQFSGGNLRHSGVSHITFDTTGLYVAWGSDVYGVTGQSLSYLTKYDLQGSEIWTVSDNDAGTAEFSAVAATDRVVYVGGIRRSSANLPLANNTFASAYDPAGQRLWTHTEFTQEFAEQSALAADQTGIYSTGFIERDFQGIPYSEYLAVIKKSDPDGNVLWRQELRNETLISNEWGTGIAVHGDALYVGINSTTYSNSGQFISLAGILMKLDSGAPPINDGPPPQIAAAGIRNSASLVVNSSIAQGSIFTVFGDNLGPATPVQASGFPLRTSGGLAGTSIRVTVNGTSLDAPILYTSAKQVAAILPSATPLGNGTLTVTYNGLAASPASVTVVERSFAIYTVNQNGQGPGVVQNVYSPTDIRTNTLFETARPGQVAVLWGTGLGAVGGNEAGGVLPGDQTSLDMHLWVGGRDATVFYRGRSGCCAGVDQINFVVPDGIEGCYVPITVQIGDSISPYSSMSIRSGGGTCSLPYGLTSAELDAARARGSIRLGNIFFDTLAISYSGGPEIDQAASAYFYNYPVNEFGTPDQFTVPIQAGVEGSIDDLYGLSRNIAVGSCTVSSTSQTNLPLDRALDAGLVTASGRVLSKYPPGAYYNLILPQTFNVSVDNAGGGTGASAVGPFQVSTLGAGAFSTIMVTGSDRAKGIQIKWTGGDPHGFVYVVGWTDGISSGAGTIFSCLAPGSAGTFFVPPSVTLALPESKTHTVGFELLNMPSPVRFDAAGLDAGFLTIENQSIREVDLN